MFVNLNKYLHLFRAIANEILKQTKPIVLEVVAEWMPVPRNTLTQDLNQTSTLVNSA